MLLVECGEGASLRTQVPELVEDVDVALRVEQDLVLVLAADIDERFADLTEHGHGSQVPVDVDPVLA